MEFVWREKVDNENKKKEELKKKKGWKNMN